MIQELQQWVLRVNEQFTASPAVINFITGLIVAVAILSMDKFKYTYSSQYKWSKPLYYGATICLLLGIGINRLVNYPSSYPLSSCLYLLAYLLFTGFILYAGSNAARRTPNGRKTDRTTENPITQR